MHLMVCCASGLCSLSFRERAEVRVPGDRKKPLTLPLSQRERGQTVQVKINVTMHYQRVTEASGLRDAWTSSSVGHQSGRWISQTRSRMIVVGAWMLYRRRALAPK